MAFSRPDRLLGSKGEFEVSCMRLRVNFYVIDDTLSQCLCLCVRKYTNSGVGMSFMQYWASETKPSYMSKKTHGEAGHLQESTPVASDSKEESLALR